MRKRLLTLSLAKSRYIAESVLKTYEQLIGGDMHYIKKNFSLKKCAIERLPNPGCELHVLLIFTTIIGIFLLHVMFREMHR